MRIAVISDTHDHLGNLDKAIGDINGVRVDALLHCGDLCSPFVIERLAAFEGPIHIVFGNNEGDRYTIELISEGFDNIEIHGEVGFLETPEGKVAFTHRPEFARGLASTGSYIAVFYGHTHVHTSERIGVTHLVNPGELMGLREEPGWIVFDLETGEETRYSLDKKDQEKSI
jgi:putative phosphoesterase